MSTLIIDTIREILIEEQQVCLPGIGTLELRAKPVLLSPAEGKITPPGSEVNFNPDLLLDDGRIHQRLADIPVLSPAEAQGLLDNFLAQMQEELQKGQTFSLAGIGRFFRRHDGELQFTATGENFGKAAFGLPELELRPIARTERAKASAAADPNIATDPLSAPAPRRPTPANDQPPATEKDSWSTRLAAVFYHPDFRNVLWYIFFGLVALVILLSGYWGIKALIRNTGNTTPVPPPTAPLVVEDPPARRQLPPVDAERVGPGEPPRLDEARKTATSSAARQNDALPRSEVRATETAAEAQAAAPIPYNIAFIATGLYGSTANVRKNEQQIRKAGYEAFQRTEGRYTRVGVRVQYTDRGDLTETLRAVQRMYDDAFVMEINGETVKIK